MLEQLFRSKRVAEVVEGLAAQLAEQQGLTHLNRDDLFEAFAAYCVVNQYHSDFDPDELRSGGPNDLGIDAFAVIVNGGLYTDPDDVREAARAPKMDVHFVLVQAKHVRKFEGNVFTGLATNIINIFSDDSVRFRANPRISDLRECVRAVYKDPSRFASGRAPRLSVWYTTLGSFRESRHRAKMETAMRQLRRSNYFSSVAVRGAGAHELRDLHHDARSIESATFTMTSRVELPRMPGVNQVLFGVMPARDVVDRILLDERGGRRRFLYHDNMRDFLGTDGQKGTVNSQIRDTLTDGQGRLRFAVMNNGITIVTRSMVQAGPKLHVKDPQIVNGCQTCNVLLANRDLLDDDVMVGVRIVESDDENVITSIIKATNTQNALSGDDLVARNDYQKHLEDFFYAQPEDRRLYYERRRNQYGAKVPRSKTVTRRQLTQAYAAMWLDVPHAVTRYQSLVKTHERDLYHPSHDPLPYYTCAAALHRIVWLLGRPEGMGIEASLRPARYQLLAGIKLRLLGEGPLSGREGDIEAACNTVLNTMWHPTESKRLVEDLLPAVDAALGLGAPRSLLGQAARTPEFTDKFHQEVLRLPLPRRAAA